MADSLAALNAAVAAKLGWKQNKDMWVSPDAQRLADAGNTPLDVTRMTPLTFCEDIAAVWQIVDSLPPGTAFGLVRVGKQWLCQIGPEDGMRLEAIEDTAPLAICRAFLKLEHA